jgi:large subunit ribosomal protein L15
MKLNELKPRHGSKKRGKIVGRGVGSGHGKTATRGHKGQRSRTGSGKGPGFSGGQNRLNRMYPKRGFTGPNLIDFNVVNVDRLAIFAPGSTVTPVELRAKGLLKGNAPVKILGNGDLKVKLTVKANAFSTSAKEKIAQAGGTVEVM